MEESGIKNIKEKKVSSNRNTKWIIGFSLLFIIWVVNNLIEMSHWL